MTADKVSPTKWKVSHSGYANAPFVIFEGAKAPDYAATHPLQGVNVIAEIPHDEGPRHNDQKRYARLIAATMDMYTALRRIRSAIESGDNNDPWLHEMADTAIYQAEAGNEL
jgi:hypothetical protein